MSHAFDGHQFSQLAALAERLVTRAADHERRLVALVATVEGATAAGASTRQSCISSAPEDSEFALTSPSLPPFTDWLATARELCVASREQRLDAEAILSRLVGDPPADNGRASKRGRVLVVDDVEDNRDLVAVCLEHAGYETLTATNGLEGVIVAHYALPSVVLMDVTMPVLDGIEAARLLKASAVTQHLDVIAYTAKPEFYEGPLKRLFVGVLAKPATPDVVLASIERFAGRGPSQRSGEERLT